MVSLALAGVSAVVGFQSHLGAPGVIVLNPVFTDKPAVGFVPPGWQLKVNAGHPDIAVGDSGDGAALHFRSDKASFGLERDIEVDPKATPLLSWRWKVAQLPKGGDFRHSSTDDQAAQLLVAFTDRKIITYIWDSSAPQGTMQSASSLPLVHIYAVVCRSGAADINQWVQETRNVAADYQKAFGQSAPHVKGLRLQINSQHTGSRAESYFGEIEFHNNPQS